MKWLESDLKTIYNNLTNKGAVNNQTKENSQEKKQVENKAEESKMKKENMNQEDDIPQIYKNQNIGNHQISQQKINSKESVKIFLFYLQNLKKRKPEKKNQNHNNSENNKGANKKTKASILDRIKPKNNKGSGGSSNSIGSQKRKIIKKNYISNFAVDETQEQSQQEPIESAENKMITESLKEAMGAAKIVK